VHDLLVVLDGAAQNPHDRLAQTPKLLTIEIAAALIRREAGLPEDLIDPRAPDASDRALVTQQRVQRPGRAQNLA
jgi:hypothetical protein